MGFCQLLVDLLHVVNIQAIQEVINAQLTRIRDCDTHVPVSHINITLEKYATAPYAVTHSVRRLVSPEQLCLTAFVFQDSFQQQCQLTPGLCFQIVDLVQCICHNF